MHSSHTIRIGNRTIPKPLLALLLVVPAPSLGAFAAMIWLPDNPAGSALFLLCKVWLLAVPLVWHLAVERGAVALFPVVPRGLLEGAVTGGLLSAVIVAAWFLGGRHLVDQPFLAARMAEIGLASPLLYAGMAIYWILVNSLLEEMVWRWFVVNQLKAVVSPARAVLLSALFFSLHHAVALSVYMSLSAVLLGTAGVFAGGCVWSLLYMRWHSIWPAWLSHALADLCIFTMGAWLIFGG